MSAPAVQQGAKSPTAGAEQTAEDQVWRRRCVCTVPDLSRRTGPRPVSGARHGVDGRGGRAREMCAACAVRVLGVSVSDVGVGVCLAWVSMCFDVGVSVC